MATQANITLSAINGNHSPSERVLNLNPDRHIVQIGRASKNSNKGLLGAVDNGWFDSPVMSRNHAEISFDLTDSAITITDIGSMHGTYLNTIPLRMSEPTKLNDGDIVVFGTEVKRAEEVFPACAFQIAYEISPYKSPKTNTFSFPESSDVEDEEDCDFSDDSIADESRSSEDGMSIENQPHKASQSINTIDLTRDDSSISNTPLQTSSTLVGFHEVQMNEHANAPDINTTQATSINNADAPILVESDDEDEGFSSNSNTSDGSESRDGSEEPVALSNKPSAKPDLHPHDAVAGVPFPRHPYWFDGHNLPANAEYNILAPYDSGSPGLHSPYDSDEDLEESESSEIDPVEAPSFLEESSKRFVDSKTNPFTFVRSTGEVSKEDLGDNSHDEEYDDEDCESDFGLSEAGKEGLQRLRDEGLIGKVDDGTQMNVGDECGVESIHENLDFDRTADKELVLSGTKGGMTEVPSNSLSAQSYMNECPPPYRGSGTLSLSNPRQPSPSDAAMAKSTVSSSLLEINVHNMPSEKWRQYISQTLSEKTGKHAFFEARDQNRSVFQAISVDRRISLSNPQQSTAAISDSTHEELMRQRAIEEAANKHDEAQRVILGEPIPGDAVTETTDRSKSQDEPYWFPPTIAMTSAPPAFLDDHSQAGPAQRSLSPEPDMTSAMIYNESKVSMAAANKTSAIFSGRSGLRIHDIIDDAVADTKSKSMKRKADDISEVAAKEYDETSSGLENQISFPDIAELKSQTVTLQETDGTKPTARIEQRPTKKMRRFVERLGYAAIGGAAVGAGLFSVLVATAPDFM